MSTQWRFLSCSDVQTSSQVSTVTLEDRFFLLCAVACCRLQLQNVILLDLLVVGVKEALRFVAWLTAGGGGGMVGGVDLGWVFTSAGESGIVPTVCTLLPVI